MTSSELENSMITTSAVNIGTRLTRREEQRSFTKTMTKGNSSKWGNTSLTSSEFDTVSFPRNPRASPSETERNNKNNSLAQATTSSTLTPPPMLINSDNQSAIALAKDNRFHACTKHVDIRHHSICYTIENGKIQLQYCLTEEMTADIFTKALPSLKVKHFASQLRLSKV